MRGATAATNSPDPRSINVLDPDEGASGLRNNFEATILSAKYEPWDFKGHARPSSKFGRDLSGVKFAIHLVLGDADDGGKDEDVYWSGGAIEDFTPNDEGTDFELTGKRDRFSKTSEILQGMDYVIKSGALKKSDIGRNPAILEGLRFYWERKPALWATEKRDDGKEGPDNLMPVKFIGKVGAGGTSRTRAASSTTSTTSTRGSRAAAAASEPDEPTQTDPELVALGVKLVMEVLDDLPKGENTIGREALGADVLALALTKYKKGPEAIDKDTRAAIGELFETDDFLEENAGRKTWKYSTKTGEVTQI